MVSRPLSPHLSIYRKQITSVLSILHRLTGVGLYAGLGVLIVFLYTAAYCPESHAKLHECLSSVPGKLLLFGWTPAFYFHLFNGLRHLYWDTGKGFDMNSVNTTGWLSVVFTIAASILSWFIAYQNLGAM